MQSNGEKMDFESCLARIENDVDELMNGMNRPELIVGAEMAVGRYFQNDVSELSGDAIPGRVTDRLSAIAKSHGIYFLPGSMIEAVETADGKKIYNTLPIFGPDGRLIDKYRKICPYYPVEEGFARGERYVTFKIEEKDITVGVMICHDWCFPEISRNLALRGAEILIRPAIDPEGLYDVCKTIPQTRAFENQCYFISLNMTGKWLGSYAYGHSMVASPEGGIVYEAGDNPSACTITLDVDRVRDARMFGTCYTEQLLRQLKRFDPSMDIYDDLEKAPVYMSIDDPDLTVEARDEHVKMRGLQIIGRRK
ncbi:MAG: carbon-nitrogen hydrolase family protein [Eubacteriaceae bacterium]|nr:carbon-nitrogen hydrolase family protein [Eubacteriaceae bacterium]